METFSGPKLNVVIMVIGSQGDVQHFLTIGNILKAKYGHRVRIATHPVFRKLVQERDLEFFSVGGDPAEMVAFRIANPGLSAMLTKIRSGQIRQLRDSMLGIFQGYWRACVEDRDHVEGSSSQNPFVADAIIASYPCYAHIHCAERLGIPLHLMFTASRTPTKAIPHTQSLWQSNVDTSFTNLLSYYISELITWQSFGSLLNKLRVETLGLEPISPLWGPNQFFRMRIPHTYLWSPELLPRPKDWGSEIDLVGFAFTEASPYTPPKSLSAFLDAGERPIFIGFSSVVVSDPSHLTSILIDAVNKAGVRAIIASGWTDLGNEQLQIPENIYFLDKIPYDWLFPRVSAVIHHGGAGSTSTALKYGKPTVIVPFIGDNYLWGAIVARAGAGAHAPIPYMKLTTEALAEAIRECLRPEAIVNATKVAEAISREGNGAHKAVASFLSKLPSNEASRCYFFKNRLAIWQDRQTGTRLSALAAYILLKNGRTKLQGLEIFHQAQWCGFASPGDPLTGAMAVLVDLISTILRQAVVLLILWAETTKHGIFCMRKIYWTRPAKVNKSSIMGYESDSSSVSTHLVRDSPILFETASKSEIGRNVTTFQVLMTIACHVLIAPLSLLSNVFVGLYNFLAVFCQTRKGNIYLRPFHFPRDSFIGVLKALVTGVAYTLNDLVLRPRQETRMYGVASNILCTLKTVFQVFLVLLGVIIGLIGYALQSAHMIAQKRIINQGETVVDDIKLSRIKQGKVEYEQLMASSGTKMRASESDMVARICHAWDTVVDWQKTRWIWLALPLFVPPVTSTRNLQRLLDNFDLKTSKTVL